MPIQKKQQQHPWLMMGKERNPIFLACIGVNGTGKSTFMKNWMPLNDRNIILPANMIEAAKTWGSFPKLKPQHDFEVDQFDPKKKRLFMVWKIPNVRTFKGNRLIDVGVFREGSHKRSFFESICDTNSPYCYRDGALFVDDTKNYIISKGDLPNRIVSWFTARRHCMMDIFLAFHSFQDVNAQMIQYGLKFILFKTDLPPYGAVLEKISCVDDLIEMRNYVNKKAKTNPYYWEAFDPVDAQANEIWRKNFRK